MAINSGYLVVLCCMFCVHSITIDTGYTKTVCTSTSCIDYGIKCFTNGVIAVQNVWINENETCGSEAEMYQCCCTNHLTGTQYLNESALSDLKQLCDSNTYCRLWPFIYDTTWKITMKFDCVEVTVSTREISSTEHPSLMTSEGAIPDTTATPSGNETEESITTKSSTAHRSHDNATTPDKIQDTSTVQADLDVTNTTWLEGNGTEVSDRTETFTFPMLEGAIILALCAIFTVVGTIVAFMIRRRRNLHEDEHRIRLEEEEPPANSRQYEDIDDVTNRRNDDVTTKSHNSLYSDVRKNIYDRVVLEERKAVRSDRTYDHIRHCGNRTNQQILHVTNTAYIPDALDN